MILKATRFAVVGGLLVDQLVSKERYACEGIENPSQDPQGI